MQTGWLEGITLQDAVSATGNGTAIPLGSRGGVSVQISGTFTATVSFEAAGPTGNYVSVRGYNITDGTYATSTTSTGVWFFELPGCTQFRAPVTWSSGTSVTVKASAVANYSSSGSGVLPTGSSANQIQGNVADDAVDSGNPVKVGASAQNPDSLPTAASANDRVNLVTDLSRRLIIYEANTHDPVNDGISAARPNSQSVAVTTSGANYASGDDVGGIISLTTINYASGRRVVLRTLQVNDKGGVAPSLNIYFFKATPASGTYTDNSALAWGTGDSANKVGQVKVLNADYLTENSQSSANYGNLGIKMPVSATTLFMLIVSEGAYTITNGNLTLNLEFDQE